MNENSSKNNLLKYIAFQMQRIPVKMPSVEVRKFEQFPQYKSNDYKIAV
jgi:hypothetical protein